MKRDRDFIRRAAQQAKEIGTSPDNLISLADHFERMVKRHLRRMGLNESSKAIALRMIADMQDALIAAKHEIAAQSGIDGAEYGRLSIAACRAMADSMDAKVYVRHER